MAVSLKKVAEAMMDEIIGGWHVEEVIPHGNSEAGPVKKYGDSYRFDVTYFRQRGHPKKYRLTVEEIH